MLSSACMSRRFFKEIMRRPSFLALLAGTLVLAAFYIPHAWFFAFGALAPLFCAIRAARGAGHAFLVGLLCGAIISGGTSFWYFSSISPLPESGPLTGFLVIAACFTAMTSALAPSTGLFAVFAYTMQDSRFNFLLVPLAWIASEYARLYGFLFVTFAPGVDNPPFYSTGFLGYPLADSLTWLQLSSVGGVYLMSFAAAAAGYAFYLACRLPWKRAVRVSGTIAAALLIFTLIPLAGLREQFAPVGTASIVRVGIMSVSLPVKEQVFHYKEGLHYKELVAQQVAELAKGGAHLILLPEGGRFFTSESDTPLEVPVVVDNMVGSTSYGTVENAAYAGSIDGARVAPIRAKRILTPQGEYVISLAKLFAPLAGLQEEAAQIARSMSIETATWGSALSIPGTNVKASVLFCIEIIAPWFGSAIVREQDTDLLLVLISQGRFKHPYTLQVDTLRFLKVRAVEANRPVVVSADHARGYALDRLGRVHAVLGNDHEVEGRIIDISVSKQK